MCILSIAVEVRKSVCERLLPGLQEEEDEWNVSDNNWHGGGGGVDIINATVWKASKLWRKRQPYIWKHTDGERCAERVHTYQLDEPMLSITEPPTVTCWEIINGGNVFSTFYQHGATWVGEDMWTDPTCLVDINHHKCISVWRFTMQHHVAHEYNLMCINYVH